jgi:hypothetical protein
MGPENPEYPIIHPAIDNPQPRMSEHERHVAYITIFTQNPALQSPSGPKPQPGSL